MSTVGAFEAKTHLSALIERVQKGECITITRHGVPVAVLVPAVPSSTASRKHAIEQLKAFGKRRKLPKGTTVRDLITEGRHD